MPYLLIISHFTIVTHGASGGECRGDNIKGTSYINSCIHSGSNDYIEDTVWYDYVLASAGTIVNKDASDITGNLNTAIESICPSGWSLPFAKQIDNNRDITNSNPVLGGSYANGTLSSESERGYWWGSEAFNGTMRYVLFYNGNNLNTGYTYRHNGFYIRCVSEEKTVTDLTYMQDMTNLLRLENLLPVLRI